MKTRLLSIVLALLMLFSLTALSACNTDGDSPADGTPPNTDSTPPSTDGGLEDEKNETLGDENTEPTPTFETVTYEQSVTVLGNVDQVISPDVLVVELKGIAADLYGKAVHVVTGEADHWCVGDVVVVHFAKYERPSDTAQPIRLYANRVRAAYETVCYKPIIYLYPETPTECSVRLTLDGTLTCTYPAHGAEGWQGFTAYPDGTLVFPDGEEYYALYWEGAVDSAWDFSEGFCVKGEDTAAFLEWALAAQGLSRREANEFIVYWLPLMQENAYNVISFQTDAYTEGALLDIAPAPDSLLRVFMAYYASKEAVEIAPQVFEGFERRGFTVVEWGGSKVG